MEKRKGTLYWIMILLLNLIGYVLFGIIVVMLCKMPNTIFSGYASWAIIICMMLYAGDDELRDAFKKIVGIK